MSSSTPTKRLSKSKTPTKKKSPLSLNDTTEEDDTLQELHLQEASPVDEREPHTYQTKKKRKRKGSWDNRPIEEVFGDSDDVSFLLSQIMVSFFSVYILFDLIFLIFFFF